MPSTGLLLWKNQKGSPCYPLILSRRDFTTDIFLWTFFFFSDKPFHKTAPNGHLEISASTSQHQHRHFRRHRHRHCKFYLLSEALNFAFRSFLWSKTSMVKSFLNTLPSFPGNVCCCLEQLFCRDVVSACFWKKELRHGRYFRSFKNTQDWKLQLVCICISDKESY